MHRLLSRVRRAAVVGVGGGARKREAGQGTLEYVGMIAVAAILVIAILQATRSVDLAGFFTDQINRVKGGG